MNRKSQFKEQVKALLTPDEHSFHQEEKIAMVSQYLVEVEKEEKFDKSNKGKSW